jgi:hypothetical protein
MATFQALDSVQSSSWCTGCDQALVIVRCLRDYLGEGDPAPIDAVKESDIRMDVQCPKCIFIGYFNRTLTRRILARDDKSIEEALALI